MTLGKRRWACPLALWALKTLPVDPRAHLHRCQQDWRVGNVLSEQKESRKLSYQRLRATAGLRWGTLAELNNSLIHGSLELVRFVEIYQGDLNQDRSLEGLGGRGLSHLSPHCGLPQQEKMCLSSPTGRCFLLYYPWRRKGDFLCPQQQPSQWETMTTQLMKSHYTSNSQFSPKDSLFITVPPNFPSLYIVLFSPGL